MNNADLLEKLSMIQEAVKRNPEWWREIEMSPKDRDNWFTVEHRAQMACMFNSDDFRFRLKPQRKWAEGWVDAEVIRWADYLVQTGDDKDMPTWVAQALLQLAKGEGDGCD